MLWGLSISIESYTRVFSSPAPGDIPDARKLIHNASLWRQELNELLSYRCTVKHGGHENIVPRAVNERHMPLKLPSLSVFFEAVGVVRALGPVTRAKAQSVLELTSRALSSPSEIPVSSIPGSELREHILSLAIIIFERGQFVKVAALPIASFAVRLPTRKCSAAISL